MQFNISSRLCTALTSAVLMTGLVALPGIAAAQEYLPVPNPINPSLDPPMPPGSIDDIAARMAARRAAQTNPTAPITIAPATSIPPTSTMSMNYENAPVDIIMKDMARAFGFIIVVNTALPQRVTVHVPNSINADEAVGILNSMLLTQGYGTISSKTDSGPQAKTILRVATVLEVKKSLIPVYEGADPNMIPLNDTLITQIIPLKYISAVGLRNDLIPMISNDADVTANNMANCIIITDTSAKIHRLVSILATLDKIAADRPAPAPPVAGGRGSMSPRPSDIPYIMSMVVDGGAFQIRHGDILGEVICPRIDITAPVAGTLAKVNVHDGQSVKVGDILFELDPRAAQTELLVAQARLASARAKLPPAGTAGQSEIDAAKAEIAAEEAVVELDRHNLAALQIRAPFDGTLTTVDAAPGQYLHLNSLPLTQIVCTGDLKITFKLAFNDRTRLKVGQKISFTVGDKLPAFPAEIIFISPAADSSNRTEIRARFTDATTPLIPGVLGTVIIPDL